uniref:Predicted protein putative n=1 Tax=Albugo laibachii Nc14 TaxID=890382 RepID=F0X283_9STRA|nr:predicted protein putative [Albugo laibachii Nc14]|eukprot:CCA27961.1 predicted protein putative [Albugo laibachii Nc14]
MYARPGYVFSILSGDCTVGYCGSDTARRETRPYTFVHDTFSAFGGIIETSEIMRDPDTEHSRGFGFINFDAFEDFDLAMECMNAQYLCNLQIVVQYALKKG